MQVSEQVVNVRMPGDLVEILVEFEIGDHLAVVEQLDMHICI